MAAASLSFDRTFENATGVGAPPWTWLRDELPIDASHEAFYQPVTDTISDALIAPSPTGSARRRDLGTRANGFA